MASNNLQTLALPSSQADAVNRRLASTPTVATTNPAATSQTATIPGDTTQQITPAATPAAATTNATPAVTPAAATTPNPLAGGTGNKSLDTYLGTDATYQSQLSDLMKQLANYNAQQGLQASQTQADYDAKVKAMNDQATQDRLNMRNASAAHGILYSGIYANELGQYNDTNQQQMTNLLGGLQNSKDTAQLAYNQEVTSLQSAKEQAIQQAAARRAASLGSF